MKACDDKLLSGLVEAMELDDANLEAEMQDLEPHVFSESFEKNMEKLMQRHRRKYRRRRLIRFTAVAAALLFLIGGPIFINSKQLSASALSIDIKEWLDRFFTVEDGAEGRKDEEVLFDDSQLGYIPEGFEKVLEEEGFMQVYYKYENKKGEFFVVRVERAWKTQSADSEDVYSIIEVNSAGYEYTLTYRAEGYDKAVMWKDSNESYYFIVGLLDTDELINIMNNISY